jgi:S-adenosyl-L-methionine hydrolase (adenosine-forming)
VSRPIVFLTDYGLADEFVGICHGVIASIAPQSSVIDLTHSVPRHDVKRGALMLGRATAFMPRDSVYVAVVDPGVGSDRRSVAIRAGSGALLVGPDNGLLAMAWDSLGGARAAVEIGSERVMLQPVSKTFHGRDVFAPAAAHLAVGLGLDEVGPAVEVGELRTLEMPGPMIAPGAVGARVVGVDRFGNVQLNATPADLETAGLGPELALSGRRIIRVETFGDAAEGVLAAIVDSQGQIALVVNRGSAAELLGVRDGSAVVLE